MVLCVWANVPLINMHLIGLIVAGATPRAAREKSAVLCAWLEQALRDVCPQKPWASIHVQQYLSPQYPCVAVDLTTNMVYLYILDDRQGAIAVNGRCTWDLCRNIVMACNQQWDYTPDHSMGPAVRRFWRAILGTGLVLNKCAVVNHRYVTTARTNVALLGKADPTIASYAPADNVNHNGGVVVGFYS